MSGVPQANLTDELVPKVAETQPVADDENPEKLIESIEEHRRNERPESGIALTAFRTALESVLSVRSDRICLLTVTQFDTRLWIWAEHEGRVQVTTLDWNVPFRVSTTLERDIVRRMVKAMKTLQGRLGRYSTEYECDIGGICFPWTSDLPVTPPNITYKQDNYFELNGRLLRSLGPSSTITLTRDHPEGGLRIVAASEESPLYLLECGWWPERDIECKFRASDLRMLVNRGKRKTSVYCDYPGDLRILRLVSDFTTTVDKIDVRTWTAVIGDACEHPRRFEPGLHPFEFFDLDDHGDTSKVPCAEVLGSGEGAREGRRLHKESTEDATPAWTNFVWSPWGAGRLATKDGASEAPDDIWNEPLRWNAEVHEDGRPIFVFLSCDENDFLDDEPALAPMRERAWAIMCQCHHLTWQICTIRPENFKSLILEQPWFNAWPSHVWPGVICTNQADADLRVPKLVRVPSNIHWIRAEPMLEMIKFDNWIDKIDWIILGGESAQRDTPGKPHADPQPIKSDWVRSVRILCDDRKKSFFFSQWGARDEHMQAVEVLGRNCPVPWLYGRPSTQIPGQKEKFKPLERSPNEKTDENLHFEGLRNVGEGLASETEIQIIMSVGPNAPADGSSFEAICAHVKALCAAREVFEDEFDFTVAHLLLKAKRDFAKRDEKGDFDVVASELTGVPHSMIAVYIQVAREITVEQWRQIPEEHRKVTHLLPLARLLKQGEDFADALKTLDEPKQVEPKSDDAPSAITGDDNPANVAPGPTPRKPRRNRKRESNALHELHPGAPVLREPLVGYDLSLGIPVDGVTSTREYLERVLRDQPEQIELSLPEATVRLQLLVKPASREA